MNHENQYSYSDHENQEQRIAEPADPVYLHLRQQRQDQHEHIDREHRAVGKHDLCDKRFPPDLEPCPVVCGERGHGQRHDEIQKHDLEHPLCKVDDRNDHGDAERYRRYQRRKV